MVFRGTKLDGVWVIEPTRVEDDRGFFARTWCQLEFEQRRLNPRLVQCSISYNRRKGTLRGMHFQAAPHQEAKLVRCTRGASFNVVVDLRPESTTFAQWFGTELTGDNHRMLYIPEGVAHGFQTLEDETELFYQMSEVYHPESARGVRWDDPAFAILWPLPPAIMSEKDRGFPLFQHAGVEAR